MDPPSAHVLRADPDDGEKPDPRTATQHAIVHPDVTDLYGKAGLAWLHQLPLPEPDGRLLRDDLSLLGILREQIIATDRLIAQLAQGDEIVNWLESLPGIGSFSAVLFRYEVDDMTRFRSAKKFARYTGLIPSTYASNTRVYRGSLTKQGNRWLRWAFIEAVAPALRTSSMLRRYYDQIKARRGAHDARVCTARNSPNWPGLCGPSGGAMRIVQLAPQRNPHPDATTPCPRLPSFEFWAQRPSAK